MDLRHKVGKVLVQLRKERGLTQEQVSWDVSTDHSYMSGLELGKRNMTIGKLSQIAEYYGISMSEFFKMVEAVEDYG